ncbi:hypothetical protein [Noviherbaspirillum sp.]|uniref:hypothetical protein n=1 Tax=Noviherbaspirillum sp. TaxID=1926288 RepID=UPI002FE10172
MIRFKPDTWVDALMRPFDMVSPEANTYVEIAAPDLRFAVVILLLACVGVAALRGRLSSRRPLVLLVFTILASVPWFVTSGNGRYFIPFLLLSGPIAIGLVSITSFSIAFKLLITTMLLMLQGFLLVQQSPWGAWTLGTWGKAPYFHVGVPARTDGINYLTLSAISYSLMAPQFSADAGWLNLGGGFPRTEDQRRLRAFLSSGRPLVLVAPTLATEMRLDRQPSEAALEAFQRMVARYGIDLSSGTPCDFIPSHGFASVVMRGGLHDTRMIDKAGFWFCPVSFNYSIAGMQPSPTAADPAFEALEKRCPRFFAAGNAETERIAHGFVRRYSISDTRVYVYDDGRVYYKFWRSLSSVFVGYSDQVLSGAIVMDCSKIRAPNWRRGGP